jgi:hypothetical protein
VAIAHRQELRLARRKLLGLGAVMVRRKMSKFELTHVALFL